MKNMLLCGIVVFLLSGCSQPLRTLMDVSAEQKAQQGVVKKEQARFKAVLGDARAGRIKKGTARESIVARYGEPVLNKGSYFLYRDPVGFFDSPKVYLDFDEKNILTGARIEERDARP